MNLQETDYRLQLEKDEYQACISMLNRSLNVFDSFDDNDECFGITNHLTGKLYFVRFSSYQDIYMDDYKNNEHETYYQVADVPKMWQTTPKPIRELHFETPQDLQLFFDNLAKYNRGELKLDTKENS